MSKLFIGIMSGTSIDSIDTVLVDFAGNKPQVIAYHKEMWPKALQHKLHKICSDGSTSVAELTALDVACGRVFAEASIGLLKKSHIPHNKIAAIGSHGQTVYHHPSGEYPTTLQIGDPNVIAALTNITVVADFRRRDVALGGQGAPLTPAFHDYLFGDRKQASVIVNIGGIANATFVPKGQKEQVLGFDVGPGNTLLDALARQYLKKSCDKDGEWAAQGTVNSKLLKACLSDYYFQKLPPKSTGREYFNLRWVKQKMRIAHVNKIKSQDLAATLLELTARSIADLIMKYAKQKPRVIIAGGGVHNQALVKRLAELVKPLVLFSLQQDFNIDPDHLEAMAFAWMAKNTLEGKTSNLPSVTGASTKCVLGGVYIQCDSV